MNVYVMRHGTTVWNEAGRTQGRTNNRLSRSGVELTKKVSKEHANVKFDAIICSPLMRTVQTANLMNEYHKVKVIKDQRLIEIDQGVFSGRVYKTLTEEEKKIKNSRDVSYGMESYQSVYTRILDFIIELNREKKYKNVLIVTHNTPASFIANIYNNVEIDFNCYEHLHNFKNAQVKVYKV